MPRSKMRNLRNKIRKHKRLILILLLAFGIMLPFTTLNHWWDVATWNNLFVDLGHDRSPYDTLVEQTQVARATFGAGWSLYYEGFAYPPMTIFIYYPLAKLYGSLYPLEYIQIAPGEVYYAQVPWEFNLFFKLPILLANLGIAVLLYKMCKRRRWKGVRMFLFNPYVIFISAAWMFDSIAAFFLLLATYLFEKKRYDLSAVALSFGFLTKWFPIFVLPIFCIELIQRRSWKFVRYIAIFGLVSAVCILPFLDGVMFSLNFHASRVVGGMTILSAFYAVPHLFGAPVSEHLMIEIIPALSFFVLVVGMTLIYAYLSKRRMPIRKKVLITFLVYLLVMKVVNEAYAFILIPFLILALDDQFSRKRLHLYRLIWILPILNAIIGVPISRFLVGYTSNPAILESLLLPDLIRYPLLATIAIIFWLIILRTLITYIRERPLMH